MNNTRFFSFSAYELCILHDKAFFEAKHKIIEKWEAFLSDLVQNIDTWIKNTPEYTLPNEIIHTTPKISKGENYQGMPYMVLDYPRGFGKEDSLAFRNLLLWNRGLYSTWFFEGKYIDYALKTYPKKDNTSMYLHQNTDKWIHELNEVDIYIDKPENCLSLLENTAKALKYLKFSNFTPFNKWSEIRNELPLPLSQVSSAFMNFVP